MFHHESMIDVGFIQGEEKTLLTTDLHRCGLVPAASPSITGKSE